MGSKGAWRTWPSLRFLGRDVDGVARAFEFFEGSWIYEFFCELFHVLNVCSG